MDWDKPYLLVVNLDVRYSFFNSYCILSNHPSNNHFLITDTWCKPKQNLFQYKWPCTKDLLLQNLLEIIQISQLANMLHAFAKFIESFLFEIGKCIFSIISEATVHQICADHTSCSSFAMHTVNSNYIFRVLLQEIKYAFASF